MQKVNDIKDNIETLKLLWNIIIRDGILGDKIFSIRYLIPKKLIFSRFKVDKSSYFWRW